MTKNFKSYVITCSNKRYLKEIIGGNKMISLERFNKQHHKYIYSIRWCSGVDCGYAVSGCIGTKFYMMYPLKEVIKLYNAEAKSMKRGN